MVTGALNGGDNDKVFLLTEKMDFGFQTVTHGPGLRRSPQLLKRTSTFLKGPFQGFFQEHLHFLHFL